MTKKISFLLLFLILAGQTFSQNNKKTVMQESFQKELDSLKSVYAPDTRTVIFDYGTVKTKEGNLFKFKTNSPDAYKAMNETIAKLKVKDAKCELLPSENLKGKNFAVATLSVINMRTKPRHSAEMASQALLGTPLKVYEKKNGWYRIQTPDNYIAWTDADAIALFTEKEMQEWTKAPKVIFTTTYGFAFADSSLGSPRVSDLTAGDILKLTGEKKAFYAIEFPDGRTGYVRKKDAKKWDEWLNSRTLSAGDIISTAFQFMGVPYLWGGTSPKGLDCSGFAKTVYYLNGIVLPRDASQQVLTGQVVPTDSGYKKFQPGDLLFFGKAATDSTKERVTHVAIYIGGGEFIHASGRVKVNSLEPKSPIFSAYRYRTFLHARRILSSINKNGIFKVQNNKFYRGVFK